MEFAFAFGESFFEGRTVSRGWLALIERLPRLSFWRSGRVAA
jgi:hypothetical protein